MDLATFQRIDQNSFYLKRFGFTDQLIGSLPSPKLGLVVVIPSFDEPDWQASLQSLLDCAQPACDVEVIVVVNCSEAATPELIRESQAAFEAMSAWAAQHSQEERRFHILAQLGLPKKHAGVGLARKIGMDEAVRRLEGAHNPEGIVACFDADSLVEKNYLTALHQHFSDFPQTPACAIHYEHPLTGPLPLENYQAIVNYEMHLRYYVHALQYAGYDHAYQTIGSSMAVRANIYQKQGGMNRRKAGEDFYFLHKIIPLGHFSELKNTCVIPSPRKSHRVPFGTGKAIGDILENENQDLYPSYSPVIFQDLKVFLDQINHFYTSEATIMELPASIASFLMQNSFFKHLEEIKRQSKTAKTFRNRFFRWFDGLRVLKYVHHARDQYHPNLDVAQAIASLNRHSMNFILEEKESKRSILEKQRAYDKGISKQLIGNFE